MTISQIINENKKRQAQNRQVYNPLTGEGSDCCERVLVELPDSPIPRMWLPKAMMRNGLVKALIEA